MKEKEQGRDRTPTTHFLYHLKEEEKQKSTQYFYTPELFSLHLHNSPSSNSSSDIRDKTQFTLTLIRILDNTPKHTPAAKKPTSTKLDSGINESKS